MPDGAPLKSILIVGGGTAGWMTAAALATIMPDLSVQLVESDAIASVGVGEATIPPIRLFNQMLGISDAELLQATEASYKLGIEFAGWRHPDESYLHPFGSYGQPFGAVDFHQLWLRARSQGDATSIDDYNLAALACQHRRCATPRHHDPRSPLSSLFTAWHFDAIRYAALLRRLAEQRGATRTEGMVVSATRDPASGFVRAVKLADERELAADLFIDCSGFRSLLLGKELATGFVDWSHLLPNDRAAALLCARVEEPLPFTRAAARAAGWTWRIPLQHRTGNGYVFSSHYLSEQEGLDAIAAMVDGQPLDEPRILRFTAGHRAQMWSGNVVGIGLAAGFLEPLESTSIHLIQQGVTRLVNLLPQGLPATGAASAFNHAMIREFESIRDFLVLHYWANARDEPYWRDRRATALPTSLADRIALWREQGRIERDEHELFAQTSWIAVLLGQGIVPTGYSRLADTIPFDRVRAHLAALRSATSRAVADMPAHHQLIVTEKARSPAVTA